MSRIPGLDNGDNKKNSPTWKQEYLHTPIEEPKQLATEEELKMMSNNAWTKNKKSGRITYHSTIIIDSEFRNRFWIFNPQTKCWE